VVATGLWVIAHECGHGGFSDYKLVNDTVGLISHSALLVPYFSWKFSHRNHHSNTGSTDHDEVFVPFKKSSFSPNEMVKETPLYSLLKIVLMLTVGWIPGYLFLNSTGPTKYEGKSKSHFNPNSSLFKQQEYWQIVISDIGFGLAVAAMAWFIYTFGFKTYACFYLIPYLIVNYHLVLITYLQHTDVFMPHFDESEWNWLRGALCTVDRSFGPVLDHFFHHISDTHVAHHLFSNMPFYHAQEATQALEKFLGKYYLKDETPIWTALWRSFRYCKYIEDDEPIAFYKEEWKQ
jgi:omega-6 fatty acid desaturase (delta-12 desaturase)